jgi:type VI secretion system protein ImpF
VPNPGELQPVLRSVLDRLIDEDPERASDPPVNRSQLLRDHRASVMRDLSALLNTRRRSPGPAPELADLFPSIADYGVRDFTTENLASARSREALRKSIEETILRYEPRFKRVDVILIEDSESGIDRALRMRIEGLLHAEPAPISVAFDSVLDPVSGTFDVGGQG